MTALSACISVSHALSSSTLGFRAPISMPSVTSVVYKNKSSVTAKLKIFKIRFYGFFAEDDLFGIGLDHHSLRGNVIQLHPPRVRTLSSHRSQLVSVLGHGVLGHLSRQTTPGAVQGKDDSQTGRVERRNSQKTRPGGVLNFI